MLGCKAINSFSKMCPRSSSFFPNKNSSFSQDYLGVFNTSRWNMRSLDMWAQRKPKASSNLFKNLFFSAWWWGSICRPISSCACQACAWRPAYLPSNQHSWRVLGSGVWKVENTSILLLIRQYLQLSYVALVIIHCKNKTNSHYVRIKPSLSTCTLFQGPSRPHHHCEWIHRKKGTLCGTSMETQLPLDYNGE